MSAWSHLPNAAHIDRVLADVQARPEAWMTGVIPLTPTGWTVLARYWHSAKKTTLIRWLLSASTD